MMTTIPLSGPLVLASKSPRRHELLSLMGLPFIVELKEVDESYPLQLHPAEVAIYIALQKAKAFGDTGERIVITADTIVAMNGAILGKPENADHAKTMLKALSGKTHEVYTGVVLIRKDKQVSFYDRTQVKCRVVTEDEIDFYIGQYQPFDKAGSYGIQDWWGLTVVQEIRGSYTNVMGLPTEKLYEALKIF
ncbi:Septum formation protein Maf [compost metagenome]